MQKIGSLKLNGEVFLAPMADYTNIAFRTLAREYGAALVYTELTSAKAIIMKNKKTQEMLSVSKKEKPVFLQLFGNNPKDFSSAITLVEKKFSNNFSGYDLNCGCSVQKAIKGKYGCCLMNEPELVGKIIGAMKEATTKPVTIKLRLGLKKENFLDVVSQAEKKGVDAITLHARYGEQGYSGESNWEKIRELKENTGVPVIGNGDIKSAEDTLKMKIKTNCDFLMIGRAAIGNAFIFSEANQILSGKKIHPKTISHSIKEAKRFLCLVKEFSLGVNDARPYLIAFAKGFSGASELRNKFALTKTIEEMERILNDFAGSLNN